MTRLIASALFLILSPLCFAQEFVVEEVAGLSFPNSRFRASGIADVDGDGLVDIVYTGNELQVASTLPDGSFEMWNPGSVPISAGNALLLADFNNDGRPEIVTGGASSSTVILWNLGLRRFRIETIDDTRTSHSLQAVDIDRDGKLDLLSADRYGSGEVVWYTIARGAHVAHPVHRTFDFGDPFGAVAGNLDSDNGLELAVSTSNGIYLLDWNDDGDPSGEDFDAPTLLISEPANGRRLILEDLDQNQRLDIVVAFRNPADGEASKVILLNNLGALSFSRTELASDTTGGYFRWIEAVDLEGDGDSDLVVSRWMGRPEDPGRFSIFVNDGSGRFSRTLLSFPNLGHTMFSFTIWPYHNDAPPSILPGSSAYPEGSYPLLSLLPAKIPVQLEWQNGTLLLSWPSSTEQDYDLEFSSDLRSWSSSYLSDNIPITVDTLAGNGAQLTHTLAPPDSPDLYVRVIGAPRPPAK